jgi:hypothetical protein
VTIMNELTRLVVGHVTYLKLDLPKFFYFYIFKVKLELQSVPRQLRHGPVDGCVTHGICDLVTNKYCRKCHGNRNMLTIVGIRCTYMVELEGI